MTQTVQIPVSVVVPGAAAIANAAVAAGQLGNTNLADQLSDLSTALTNLVQNPTSPVYSSQAQASLTSLISQITNDPFLSSFAAALATRAGQPWPHATTAAEVEPAVTSLGTGARFAGPRPSLTRPCYGFTINLPNSITQALRRSHDVRDRHHQQRQRGRHLRPERFQPAGERDGQLQPDVGDGPARPDAHRHNAPASP